MTATTIKSLYAGSHGPVLRPGTVAADQDLAEYSVMGLASTGNDAGTWKLCDKAATDGSQVAKAILPAALDTTGADVSTDLVRHGEVDENLLVFGGESTIDDHREELIAATIYPIARK